MGDAKRRGTHADRKANPVGKKVRTLRSGAKFNEDRQTYWALKRAADEQERRRRARGVDVVRSASETENNAHEQPAKEEAPGA